MTTFDTLKNPRLIAQLTPVLALLTFGGGCKNESADADHQAEHAAGATQFSRFNTNSFQLTAPASTNILQRIEETHDWLTGIEINCSGPITREVPRDRDIEKTLAQDLLSQADFFHSTGLKEVAGVLDTMARTIRLAHSKEESATKRPFANFCDPILFGELSRSAREGQLLLRELASKDFSNRLGF